MSKRVICKAFDIYIHVHSWNIPREVFVNAEHQGRSYLQTEANNR